MTCTEEEDETLVIVQKSNADTNDADKNVSENDVDEHNEVDECGEECCDDELLLLTDDSAAIVSSDVVVPTVVGSQEEKKDDCITTTTMNSRPQPQTFVPPPPSEVMSNVVLQIGPPKLPVDRYWLQKLLYKHSPYYNNSNNNDDNKTNHPQPPELYKQIRAYVLAPMVDQSDLPFRMQCRKYGTNIAFTPMIHTKLFATAPIYRQKFMVLVDNNTDSNSVDRPLIAQLCGSEIDYVVYTALTIAPYVDAIDINCGCPQSIAKRGMYGSFLLEQETILLNVIQHLLTHLTIPLTVKVRLLPPLSDDTTVDNSVNDALNEDESATTTNTASAESAVPLFSLQDHYRKIQERQRQSSIRRSIALYEKLVHAGIHMLTVHGRNRHHKGVMTGAADWDAIRQVVEHFSHRIPIIANGSIANQRDVHNCFQQTRADGVMSSEAILEYPPLFQGMAEQDFVLANNGGILHHSPIVQEEPIRTVGRLELALEYLHYATLYPPDQNGQGSGIKCCRIHVHRFLHADLQHPNHVDIRTLIVNATTMQQLYDACHILLQRRREQSTSSSLEESTVVAQEELSWYYRHRHITRDCFGITCNQNTYNATYASSSQQQQQVDNDDNENHDTNNMEQLPMMSRLEVRLDHERTVKRVELIDDAADCFANLFDEEED